MTVESERLKLKLEIARLREEIANLKYDIAALEPPKPTTKSVKFGFEWTT